MQNFFDYSPDGTALNHSFKLNINNQVLKYRKNTFHRKIPRQMFKKTSHLPGLHHRHKATVGQSAYLSSEFDGNNDNGCWIH